jgi:hypothetical protein
MPIAPTSFDRVLARTFVAFLAIVAGALSFALYTCMRPALTNERDVHFDDPVGAIRSAQGLVAQLQANAGKYRENVAPQDLPPALRIRGLLYANIHPDHVDLVLARNPDWRLGARIWAAQHQPHHDVPTSYRDIWFYRYTNDAPVSTKNIP